MGAELIDIDHAAKLIGISKSTLNKMRLTGAGPTYFKIGSRVLYSPDDIAAWLQSKRRRATSDGDA